MAFADIKGHDIQVRALINSINADRQASAYIFVGPSGIGKKSIALNFAKFINCSNRDALDEPCEQCLICKQINAMQHPDIFLVSPDSSNTIKIEDIRQIIKRGFLRAYEAKYKVFIIDEAETMTTEAANALLKTLEESSRGTVFILVTSLEKKLPATVISRCRRIKFNALSLTALKEILISDYHLDEKKAHFISFVSEGRVSESLRLKDADILKKKNEKIDDFINSRVSFKDRDDARYRLNLFLGWLRDLLLLKIDRDGYLSGKDNTGLINIDRLNDLSGSRNKYKVSELEDAIDFISEAMFYLDSNVNVKLLNNLTKVKLCKN